MRLMQQADLHKQVLNLFLMEQINRWLATATTDRFLCRLKTTSVGQIPQSLLIGYSKSTLSPKEKMTYMKTTALPSLDVDVSYGVNNVRVNQKEEIERQFSPILRPERKK